MKKKYAFYCSGGASRVFKFYNNFHISDYNPELMLYDGNNQDVITKLNCFFSLDIYLENEQFEFSDYLLTLLDKHNVNYLFCFGKKILKGHLIDKYQNKIINFHPSLLPNFPGLNSIDRALASNIEILGNTAHFIDNGIDTGPIIMQTFLPKEEYKDYEDLLGLQINMLKKIWDLLEQDSIKVENNQVFINNSSI